MEYNLSTNGRTAVMTINVQDIEHDLDNVYPKFFGLTFTHIRITVDVDGIDTTGTFLLKYKLDLLGEHTGTTQAALSGSQRIGGAAELFGNNPCVAMSVAAANLLYNCGLQNLQSHAASQEDGSFECGVDTIWDTLNHVSSLW